MPDRSTPAGSRHSTMHGKTFPSHPQKKICLHLGNSPARNFLARRVRKQEEKSSLGKFRVGIRVMLSVDDQSPSCLAQVNFSCGFSVLFETQQNLKCCIALLQVFSRHLRKVCLLRSGVEEVSAVHMILPTYPPQLQRKKKALHLPNLSIVGGNASLCR